MEKKEKHHENELVIIFFLKDLWHILYSKSLPGILDKDFVEKFENEMHERYGKMFDGECCIADIVDILAKDYQVHKVLSQFFFCALLL